MPTRPSRRYSGVVLASQMRAELDRLIQEVVAATETARPSGWAPATDVLDLGHALLIQLEVAGLQASDLKVELEGTTVRIRGRRKLAFPRGARVRFHCVERQEGEFERLVEVFEPVNIAKATATLERGLLCIELPKVEERRKRVVTLEVSEKDEQEERE